MIRDLTASLFENPVYFSDRVYLSWEKGVKGLRRGDRKNTERNHHRPVLLRKYFTFSWFGVDDNPWTSGLRHSSAWCRQGSDFTRKWWLRIDPVRWRLPICRRLGLRYSLTLKLFVPLWITYLLPSETPGSIIPIQGQSQPKRRSCSDAFARQSRAETLHAIGSR